MTTPRAHYRIGKISELMGISTEALRYYEREGLVAPEKSNDSGYRSYTAWDIHVLIRTRMYRKYGLTLDETISAFDTREFDEVNAILEAKEKQLHDAILENQRLLERLHHDRYSIYDARLNLGKFRVENSPAMRFIDVQRSYNLIDQKTDAYRQWIEKVPYVVSGGIFDYPVLKDGELRYGLLIEEGNLNGVPPELLEDTIVIPPQKCLTTFFVSGSDKELCLDMFQPAFDYLESQGLSVSGAPFARMVHMYHQPNGEYCSWYQGWVPFKGDFQLCTPVPATFFPEQKWNLQGGDYY